MEGADGDDDDDDDDDDNDDDDDENDDNDDNDDDDNDVDEDDGDDDGDGCICVLSSVAWLQLHMCTVIVLFLFPHFPVVECAPAIPELLCSSCPHCFAAADPSLQAAQCHAGHFRSHEGNPTMDDNTCITAKGMHRSRPAWQ